MTLREQIERSEHAILRAEAAFADRSLGREREEAPDGVRTCFMRDRDRIIHSKAFRRLKHKTQVFLSPEGDHYRTRLTHTLEVAQISRTVARALRLNEDLAEAIALGHDLGHTPFGHAGETVMQQCFSPEFTHYKQSLRVVEKLENNGAGLNLTWEVRDGIVNHTGDHLASTLEGVIVKFADRIAYINHDIDDACRAGIMSIEDIPIEIREVLGEKHGVRVNRMVSSVIEASADAGEIRMTPEVGEATTKLRKFLFDNVYYSPIAKAEEVKAMELLARLYEYFVRYPQKMPEVYRRNMATDPVERCVCDFISSMTDRYAIDLYKDLFVPSVWRTPN
jgi:dGTPase